MNRFYLLAGLLFLASCGLFKPTTTPLDYEADMLLSQGKRLLQTGKYDEALDKFELVRSRNFNRSTTAAIYLSGLSAYYLKFDDIASQRFETIIEEYPRSRYVEDATYHAALVKARSRNRVSRYQGFDDLQKMAKEASSTRLSADAKSQINRLLYTGFQLEDVKNLYARASSANRQMIVEALVYRMASDGDYENAREVYDKFLKSGGKDSDYLQKIFPKIDSTKIPPAFEPEIIRLAMFLPFFVRDENWRFSKTIPAESQRALEFYEGFRLAVDEFNQSPEKGNKKVYLEILDTRRDSNITRTFYRQLDSLRPAMIIGGVYNSQSRVLSEWAEENKTLQIIPISATAELVDGKAFTFLAHPSAYTHGKRMAEYAFHKRGVTYTAVFTDGTSGTEDLAKGYIETFEALGGSVDTLKLHPDYENFAIDEIPDLVDEIPFDSGNVGVYIPLMGNEESASLIVNVLKKEGRNLTLMGSPHFRSRYNTLDRDTKESFGLIFTTSHFTDESDPEYLSLYKRYLEKYSFPPSDNIVQGYDLARYILMSLQKYNPALGISQDTYLRVSPLYRGIHIDYRFNTEQSNQEVNIGMYTPEGVIRVNEE